MTRVSLLLGISAGTIVLSAVFFLLFSWITVRKLKKNPETMNALGFEFISGWNILNTAQALSLPKFLTQRIKKSPGSFLFANAELLRQHTNKLDRFLARLFYWSCASGTISFLAIGLLNELNIIN